MMKGASMEYWQRELLLFMVETYVVGRGIWIEVGKEVVQFMLGVDEGGGLCEHDGCEEDKDKGS